MLAKVSSIRLAFRATDEKFVKLWEEKQDRPWLGGSNSNMSYSDIFMWAARKATWYVDVEKFEGGKDYDESPDVLRKMRDTGKGVKSDWSDLWSDLFRFVWIPAIEKWDNKLPESQRRDPTDPQHAESFYRWVLMLLGNKLTELKKFDMTQKNRARKRSEPIEVPRDDQDPSEGVYEDITPAEGEASLNELNSVLSKIEDKKWLQDALTAIKDEKVKAAVAIIVKYGPNKVLFRGDQEQSSGPEETSDMFSRLKAATGMTWPKLRDLLASDEDLRALLMEGLQRNRRKRVKVKDTEEEDTTVEVSDEGTVEAEPENVPEKQSVLRM